MLLSQVLPPEAMVVESRCDVGVDTLLPSERAGIAGAGPARQAEYATVRHCAREALGRLGVPAAPIGRAARGAPVWPPGVVGSMTHCRGFRAAAVARDSDLITLGIDAEPADRLREGVLARITRPDEAARVVALLEADPAVAWDRALFSVKESLFKAWYPLVQEGLDFREAEVTLHTDNRCDVSVRRPVPGAMGELAWRAGWVVQDGIVATAVWVSR